jgi:hypothetical protein
LRLPANSFAVSSKPSLPQLRPPPAMRRLFVPAFSHRHLARDDLRSFVGLIGRIIPLQVQAKGDVQVEVTYRSLDEIRQELSDRGISMAMMSKIFHQPTLTIEHDDDDED